MKRITTTNFKKFISKAMRYLFKTPRIKVQQSKVLNIDSDRRQIEEKKFPLQHDNAQVTGYLVKCLKQRRKPLQIVAFL